MSRRALHLGLCLFCIFTALTNGSRSSSDSDSDSDDSSQTISTAAPSSAPTSQCPVLANIPSAASYFYEEEIEIGNDNLVDTVTIHDVTLISFDIQIEAGFECPADDYCNIFNLGYQNDVGGGDSTKFPFMTLTDTQFRVQVRDDSGNNPYNVENSTFLDDLVNGSWHSIQWVQANSRGLFANDRELLWEWGPYNVSSVVGADGTDLDILIAPDNDYELVPGTIRNLCIQTLNLEEYNNQYAAVTTSRSDGMGFAAGSNKRNVIEFEPNLHSESEYEPDSGLQSQPEMEQSQRTVTVTLSTATWVNLWGVVMVIMLFNMALGAWCMRKRKRVEYEYQDADGMNGMVRYKEDV